MIKLSSQKLLSQFILCSVLTACGEFPIDVSYTSTFYDDLNIIEQIRYKDLIAKSLDKDKVSLVKLSNFDCGGGSGCYWHGEVLTKIAYHIGEAEFIKLTSDMNNREKIDLHVLISVGLEYGKFKNKQKDLRIENEFPNLNRVLISGDRQT
jgi:hypothetical protein